MPRAVFALIVAAMVVLGAVVLFTAPRSLQEAGPASIGDDDAGEVTTGLGGEPPTLERVREACEGEIVLRSDLPFTEFPLPGTTEWSEPHYDESSEAWLWTVELVYEEGMALRREWECRITAEGRGFLRRNY